MPDRFDKFTERARKVLTLAQEEAQRFNHNYIGTEHLLLGLVREGDGVAAKVLANLGLELDKARWAVEAIVGQRDRMVMGEIGLTPRAKKVIELAVDEARRLNHHYIGTEHLLLGLVREGEGVAARALIAQGVSLASIRDEVLRILSGQAELPSTGAPASTREAELRAKFNEPARRAMDYAREEARQFNHNYVGTEHLLLGLLREDEGAAGLALRNLGVSLDRVRQAVEFIIGRGDRPILGEIGLTPRVRKVIELAADEARRLEDDHIGTEHLLLGLAREGEGIAAGVLESLGVSWDRVRLADMHVRREITAVARGMPSTPALGALVRVLPLAQTLEHQGWEVTLLSLETYPGGFVLNGRLLRGGAVDPFTIPEPTLVAHDDQGVEYQPSPIGSGVDSRTWRFAYRFSPPLDPAARELTVGVAQIGWRQLLGMQQTGATEQVTSGSWTFDIDISGS